MACILHFVKEMLNNWALSIQFFPEIGGTGVGCSRSWSTVTMVVVVEA